MVNVIIDSVKVRHDPRITEDEIRDTINEERVNFAIKNKVLGSLELTLDGDEMVIVAKSKEPIKRLRRITGYLSDVTNFNDGKRAELADRRNHQDTEYNYRHERNWLLEV